MDLFEVGNRFLSHQPIPNVAFEHNDYVHITHGDNSGQFGSLVTVAALEPEIVYVVELESGIDVQISQSHLQRADV